jgi:hypothetical protein
MKNRGEKKRKTESAVVSKAIWEAADNANPALDTWVHDVNGAAGVHLPIWHWRPDQPAAQVHL